ncbi:MAG: YidC/Oxa1 family membrane protein insertase [Eggerthellaceae bacterium]|jgi:YidC/Oxa1 family membrane protein insertase
MWEAFKDLIFQIIQFFYGFCGDWGLAIVVVTIIFRVAIGPLMRKQTKSSYDMQKVQPLLREVQERFKDDPQRMREETSKIYAEAKFNPMAGCLPLLLQMPIFIALFQVLREMGERVSGTYEFYNLVPNLTMAPDVAFTQGIGTFVPYLILMIVFAGATFLPMVLQQRGSTDIEQKKQTYIMSGIMSVFMLWIGWSSPGGVLLFWGTSSIIGIIQQQATMHRLKKHDDNIQETIEVKPIVVDVERRTKKKRPTKKRS